MVLFEASAWPLLYGYHGLEYRFFIFSSWQKFLYARLSNSGPLSETIDQGIPNWQTIFF